MPPTISLLGSDSAIRLRSRYSILHYHTYVSLPSSPKLRARVADETLNALRSCCRVCGGISGFSSGIEVGFPPTKGPMESFSTKQKVGALPHWVAGSRSEAIQKMLVGRILNSRPLLHAAAASAIGYDREQRHFIEDSFV